MPQYRAEFMNHGGHVYRIVEFEAEHDEQAKERAKREFSSGIGFGYEIRDGNRHVHTEQFR